MKLMQIIPAGILVLVAVLHAGCSSSAIDFSGYYYSDNEITSVSTGESSVERSWIRILPREDGRYDVTGMIVGANYHICEISGDEGNPLVMKVVEDFILYTRNVPQDVGQVACSLMIHVDDEDLVMVDPGNNSARWLFAAGTRVTLDGLRFPLIRYRTREYYEQLEIEEDR
jgi:hypothetical protein